DGRACPARQKVDLDLVARRARRARRRPEDAARDQEHGRRERGGLARAARRPRPAKERHSWKGTLPNPEPIERGDTRLGSSMPRIPHPPLAFPGTTQSRTPYYRHGSPESTG